MQTRSGRFQIAGCITGWLACCVAAALILLVLGCRKKDNTPPPAGSTQSPTGTGSAAERTPADDTRTRPAPSGRARPLLADDLSNCTYDPAGWRYENGVLTWLESHGDVWTKDQYGDFILELDWKISPECNSGVIIRCSDPADWMYTGLEVQIHESGDGSPHGQCGAIYDLVSPIYYANAVLTVSRDNQSWAVCPVRGNGLDLPGGTRLTVVKQYDNLKFLERNGRRLPYDAPSDAETNPAVMVKLTDSAGQTTDQIVYADAAKTDAPGPYRFTYTPGHWLPDKDIRKPVGQWNHYKITAKGPRITIELNGTTIVDIDLDRYTTPGRNPQGTFNKYPVPARDLPRRGYIALQDHGRPVSFRNVMITPLD